jgi:ATP-dependent Clp protease ATP-binding subunit ClpA
MPTSRSTTSEELLTEAARVALADAAYHAAIRRPHLVGALHLLLGLVHADDSIAASVLAAHEVSDVTVWSAIDYWEYPSGGKVASPRFLAMRRGPKWRDSARQVLTEATALARTRGAAAVDTGDVLVALAVTRGSRAGKVLDRNQLGTDAVLAEVESARRAIDEGPAVAPLPDLSQARPVAWREGARDLAEPSSGRS